MRILIAHSDGLMLAGVRQVLSEDATFDVVGETHDGAEVLFLVWERQPDVLLLEAELQGIDALGCIPRVREEHPQTEVVVCSMSSEADLVQNAFERGACGFILESIHPADLATAIAQALDYGHPDAPRAPQPAPATPRPAYQALEEEYVVEQVPGQLQMETESAPTLTVREESVLDAVARGLANKAIAAELSVTIQTVKFHLTHVYRKLGVTNRTEAARWAMIHGLGGFDNRR